MGEWENCCIVRKEKKNWITWTSVKLTSWLVPRSPIQCERTSFPASFASSAGRKNISWELLIFVKINGPICLVLWIQTDFNCREKSLSLVPTLKSFMLTVCGTSPCNQIKINPSLLEKQAFSTLTATFINRQGHFIGMQSQGRRGVGGWGTFSSPSPNAKIHKIIIL